MKTDMPNPEDYTRMFMNDGWGLLLNDIFLGHYASLGVVTAQDEHSWISFLPKSTKEKTLAEGRKLFTTGSLYKNYATAFEDYMRNARGQFEQALEKNVATAGDAKAFFEIASQCFSYYSKTETFYTDAVDVNSMAATQEAFERLKTDGRIFLNETFFDGHGYVRRFLEKLAKETGILSSTLLVYQSEDIFKLLETGAQLTDDMVVAHQTFFTSADHRVFGEHARGYTNLFLGNERALSDMLTGTTAFPGFVTGRARVLLPESNNFSAIAVEIERMEQGEILVAETTSPEIIAALRKAGAIVTTQGGMLSHAAITARELKIPCVIGTDKDATANIKTGDLIEVDAGEGTIRILKKV